MKATFALLANTEVHNSVRKLGWETHRKYGTDISLSRLPPHISIKQPFEVSDLGALESYMSELARSIQPFEVHLPSLQLVTNTYEGVETGILWLDVEETETLRRLHERVNAELSQRFKNTQAAFDGERYHFHMTVTIGGQSIDVFRQIMREHPNPAVNLRFRVTELVMFVYDEQFTLGGGYMVYKILPVGE